MLPPPVAPFWHIARDAYPLDSLDATTLVTIEDVNARQSEIGDLLFVFLCREAEEAADGIADHTAAMDAMDAVLRTAISDLTAVRDRLLLKEDGAVTADVPGGTAAPAPTTAEYTFNNVTITVTAATGRAAYARLCEVLAAGGGDLEYTTDTFTNDSAPDDARDTSVLSPDAPEPYLG